jgi:hypothetical protein
MPVEPDHLLIFLPQMSTTTNTEIRELLFDSENKVLATKGLRVQAPWKVAQSNKFPGEEITCALISLSSIITM